ncbi:MAG: endonuclease domain-containing protein [Desulfacinum sp.]|jgi:very-short-patch-repair endonuclease|nr:endonuclease domain-containing protein [Desulfacinum sp.]
MPACSRFQLKQRARELRKNMTDSERRLWHHLRRKQIHGIQFYRQRPLGPYIVDFYAPRVRLVIEVDGGQHRQPDHAVADRRRDAYLAARGLRVLRFSSRDVLRRLEQVLNVIERAVTGKDETRLEETGHCRGE